MFFASEKNTMLNALVLMMWLALPAVLFVVDSGSADTIRLYGEECTCADECQTTSWCRRDSEGGLRCLCLPCQYYDQELDKCVDKSVCVDGYDPNACQGLPHGDYAACSPFCQHGAFITCYDGYLYQRNCSLGYVITADGSIDTQKMIFDPDTKRCGGDTGGDIINLQCQRVRPSYHPPV